MDNVSDTVNNDFKGNVKDPIDGIIIYNKVYSFSVNKNHLNNIIKIIEEVMVKINGNFKGGYETFG